MSTILVVDDEPVNRELLATVLGYEGHAVLQAGDGAEALDIVRSNHPALVISDILMPTMDGYEFVRQLRRDPAIAHTRVMFWTANYFEREARGLATACGVHHVLTKPCEPETILTTVSAALGVRTRAAPVPDPAGFDREHLRLMTDKLSAKVRELEATHQRLSALVAIGQQLNQQDSVESLLRHFGRAGREVIAARYTVVALSPPGSCRLTRLSVNGPGLPGVARNADIDVTTSLLGRPLVEGKPVRLAEADLLLPELLSNSEAAMWDFLGVPIKSASAAYGSLCFAGKIGDEVFTDDDEQVAIGLASLLAVAYENVLRLDTLRRQNEVLEARVAQRTAELTRSNEELEQFAYVASHDLQEPLRMVASYTELLARRYKGRLDRDADDFIGYAVDGARRMQALIQDLLAYSRVNRDLRPSEVSLNEALDEALSRLALTVSETGAAITRDPMPSVLADRGRLVQLLQNLIGNALKFRGTDAPRIHIAASRAAGEWRISVADNGIGIEPQYADRIFVIFQRLHSRAAFPGTGVGLAICKRIAMTFGGRIWVESKPGSGSTFHFTIPYAPAAEAH